MESVIGLGLDVFTYEELETITKNFSAENFIGSTQYGKLYRGEIKRDLNPQEVTVKTWESWLPKTRQSMLIDEIKLLANSDVKGHPNLVKLIGYCCENGENGVIGVVYELQSLDIVHNLFHQENFKWIARIKVALRFACVLEVLHRHEFVLRNINSVHVMVDKAFNPRLLDFGVLIGGVFGGVSREDTWKMPPGAYYDFYDCLTDKTDVYAYGVLLLGLIAKREYDDGDLRSLHIILRDERKYKRRKFKSLLCIVLGQAREVYKSRKPKSLVHKDLEIEPFYYACDGDKITKMALRCIHSSVRERPTMKEVVCCLQKLKVVQCCNDILRFP